LPIIFLVIDRTGRITAVAVGRWNGVLLDPVIGSVCIVNAIGGRGRYQIVCHRFGDSDGVSA
jgi:hypothetical protein